MSSRFMLSSVKGVMAGAVALPVSEPAVLHFPELWVGVVSSFGTPIIASLFTDDRGIDPFNLGLGNQEVVMKDQYKPVSQPSTPASGRRIGTAEARASRRVDALFKAVSSDYLLREQFVTDPAQTMAEFVVGRRLTEDSADAANHLLYAVLSNARMRNWLAQYALHLGGATPSREAFAVQFARALGAGGDEITALALIRAAAAGGDLFFVQADVLRAFITV